MTETGWCDCIDPALMLRHLSGEVSDATFRLFSVGCCRRVAHLLRDPRSSNAIAVSEAFARGIASAAQLGAAREAAERAASEAEATAQEAEARVFNALDAEVWREAGAVASAARAVAMGAAQRAEPAALAVSASVADAAATVADDLWDAARDQELSAQCAVLRELVGWPVRSAVW